ncbi:MAG TPA: GNAT family N-acetyltransferase [Gemmatimonadales bacterium]|nr:GNAT family N-acetyltransferase [Gemmatimonadales bacterium]
MLTSLAPSAVVPPSTGGAVVPSRPLRWAVQATCPAEWWVHLERCGGGFFHAPPGLAAGAGAGETLFALLVQGEEVVGVAAGVRTKCRFALSARHVCFPTSPALRVPERGAEALALLVAALRAAGVAELAIDSFDARWRPAVVDADAHARDRLEFVVPLVPDAQQLSRACSTHHRRHLQRGEREGWTFRRLEPPEAQALLTVVQQQAAARAAARGEAFEAALPAAALQSGDGGAHWGATTFSAWRDGAPLAAALVGWANRRGFYLIGGSTPDGYARDAAQWLHWRIMCYLAEEGFTAYNLGGTPGSAAHPGDPAHGLYRFKAGFGSTVVPCRSVRWTLRPTHVVAHRVARWVAARVRP